MESSLVLRFYGKQVDELELNEIKNHENFPQVIHGTYTKYLDNIKVQGLSKMNVSLLIKKSIFF